MSPGMKKGGGTIKHNKGGPTLTSKPDYEEEKGKIIKSPEQRKEAGPNHTPRRSKGEGGKLEGKEDMPRQVEKEKCFAGKRTLEARSISKPNSLYKKMEV